MPNTVSHWAHTQPCSCSSAQSLRAPSRAAGLSEWYYPVEPGTGLHPRPSSASALKAYFPEIDDSWSSVWYPSRKGEDTDALHDRLAGLLDAFIPEVQRHFVGVHKRILLVGHAATVVALARELVGDRSLSFKAACCSLTILDRKGAVAGVGGWTAKLLGDGGHLKEGLQRAWGFEDAAIEKGVVSIVATVSWSVTWNLLSLISDFSTGLHRARRARDGE